LTFGRRLLEWAPRMVVGRWRGGARTAALAATR
jgi:hypothetical protein